MIPLALIDDQQLFREGIASLLKSIADFNLLIQAENGEDFLHQLKLNENIVPQIALVDMEMPIINGVALNEELQKHFPSIKVIILSVHAKERLIAQMIRAGASGYLLKNCDKEELITAIRSVHHTGFYINPYTLKAIQHAVPEKKQLTSVEGIPIRLSSREIEILQLICKEYSNVQIAELLYLSQRTVEGHRNNLLQKIGCRNTAGLVIFAVKSHIYEVSI